MLNTYQQGLMEMKSVLNLVPMGRGAWLRGVKDGEHPEPIQQHNKRLAWRTTDIDKFLRTNPKTQELLIKAESIHGFFNRVHNDRHKYRP